MHRRDELKGLLESLEDLGEGALLALSTKSAPDEEEALSQAREKAGWAADRTGRAEELERLQGEIVRWSRAGGSHSAMWVPNLPVVGDIWLADLRAGAVQAVVDAATALFLNEDLDPDSRATLRRKWDSVAN